MTIDVSIEDLSKLIDEISIGGKIVCIDTPIKHYEVIIKHCPLSIRMYSEIVYKASYDRAIKEGFLTTEQTLVLVKERNLIKQEDELKVEELREKVKAQKTYLERITKVPARREKIINNIKILESEINNILYKKEVYLSNTAERKAQEDKFLFLLYNGSFTPLTQKPFWNSIEDFNNEKDVEFRHILFIKYIEMYYGISTSLMRYLSRSSLWRIRYISSLKTGNSLFGRSISEYTIDQMALVYWSQYYHNIYSEMMPDSKPADSIIEDDDALDAFMKAYFEEQEREAVASREKRKKGKGMSAFDHGEVIVTKAHESYEDIEYTKPKEAGSGLNKNKVDLALKK